MRAGLTAAAVVVVLVAVAGCHDDAPGPVIEGRPPATPYRGPLDIPLRSLDAGGPRALRLASGAAGRALECDGEIFDGSGPDGWGPSEGGATPEEGLARYFDMVQPEVPDHGYRAERREADRVLYSFDVGGRTKVAVVVAKDQKDRPGWGPETSASCDPAELPASFTDTTDWQIWADRAGRRVPVTRLHSADGPAHCGRRSARFLHLDGRTYASDPDGVLARDGLLRAPYRPRTALPAGARDTGYHYRGSHLWRTADSTVVYVRTADGVAAWPLVKDGAGCD
ncbi:hypothetical protein NX794_30340 [Streptomyces sp. LP11]|uniref:Lipoprotein n=1 Tax=Streptomyces pyxinicus TaxID=2970331 RepID=A0ABT2BAC7_9ACTN|nr:hypothetical protein [Streptomyces sp. LP11]MCS0605471.1 hypothetical protein [Streptomyces sp. LP11]